VNRNHILPLITIALLLTTSFTLYYLKDSTPSDLRMTIFGESVQEVDHGETASYTINIRNVGEGSKNVNLQLTDVPEHWDASLDKQDLALPGNSRDTVILSVTAPSGEIAASRGVATVAGIGVRGGNITIGTITILRGSATVLRDGQSLPLGSGENISSGDIVTAQGSAIITLDVSKLFSNMGDAEGEIYVLLHDATVGFLRYEDSAFMWVVSGDVLIWEPEEGGSPGTRATPPAPPIINLSEMDVIDMEFPGQEYNVVLEFDRYFNASFFHLNVSSEETVVEVFEGEVVVTNDNSNRTLKKYEQTTADEVRAVPEALPVERTIISLDSDGSVEETVESQGTNIRELDDVYYLPLERRTYYIAPKLPDISLDIKGQTEGEYEVDISQIEEFTNKTFNVKSSSSIQTKDSFSYSDDSLNMNTEEQDKTYDLTIIYEDAKTGKEPEEFEVKLVRTSDEEQSFVVEDWEKLDDEEAKPVVFKEGEKEVKISTGTTGEELEKLIEEKEDGEEFPWIPVVGVVALIVIVIIGAAFYLGYLPQAHVEEKKRLTIVGVTTSPEPPKLDEKAEIKAIILTKDQTLLTGEHKILVGFFDGFGLISEMTLSQDQLKPDTETELPAVTWTPKQSGEREINVVIEVDDKEADVHATMVMVKD